MGLFPGAVIAQRYELERLLGEGGMGTVWSARHLLTQKRVALKFLKAAAQPDLIRRFVREARAASAVRHPNVIGIHDFLTLEDGLPAMVMDLLEGESLASRLERSGTIPVDELASIMVPVLSAVGAAHAIGIVHRDLKPDNIFLAQRGEGRVEPMVLDFGICKLNSSAALPLEASTLTVTGSMMGTPYYMAPEQVFGERDVDARADVWALGVILYECTTGTRPVDGENVGQLIKHILSGTIRPLQELAPHVPPEFASVVNRMLLQDRGKREVDLQQAFFTLCAMTDVGAQSFGAAATVQMPSVPPRSGALPARPSSPLSASAAGNVVTSSVAISAPKRPRRMIAALTALVALGLLASVLLLPSRIVPTVETGQSSSLAAAAVAPQPVPVSPAPSASASASASATATAASASARVRQALPASGPRQAPTPEPSAEVRRQAKPAPRTLAGGVQGTVPF